MASRVPFLLVVLAGCDNDVAIGQNAQCDGMLQPAETTVDDPFDQDGDGFFDGNVPDCAATYAATDLDCDDGEATVHPGAAEVCGDDLDNDCDGTDEGACASYTGTWGIDPVVSYSCAYDLVTVSFNTLSVFDAAPNITFGASGGQPGTMTGLIDGQGAFSVQNTISGACAETYTLAGTFTSADAFEATFTASFSGSYCLDCTTQTFPVTGELF
jgi:hypothetical protein